MPSKFSEQMPWRYLVSDPHGLFVVNMHCEEALCLFAAALCCDVVSDQLEAAAAGLMGGCAVQIVRRQLQVATVETYAVHQPASHRDDRQLGVHAQQPAAWLPDRWRPAQQRPDVSLVCLLLKPAYLELRASCRL